MDRLGVICSATGVLSDDGSAASAQAGARRGSAGRRPVPRCCTAYVTQWLQEMPVKKYLARKLHRSTTAAVLELAASAGPDDETGHRPCPDPPL